MKEKNIITWPISASIIAVIVAITGLIYNYIPAAQLNEKTISQQIEENRIEFLEASCCGPESANTEKIAERASPCQIN